ncbi:TolC family protein [Winogradskyella maritima]|uniref:TolC family protein n=1 Tax=Winogradskyella maritima TaxID=1517766 RepID=A0ABV8AIF8_9FLAO|nr:TolC family protein [Winogradskyella maritima]
MTKIKISVVLLVLLSSFGFSQDYATRFSLQEAIDFALANSRMALSAQLDIDAAEKQQWETIATGLPQVDFSANYQNFLKQQVSVVPNAFFDNRQSTINTVEEFFDLTANGSPQTRDGFSEIVFGAKQSVNATAQLNQLLFDGSYIVGLQASKVFLEISENAKVKTDLEIRKAVINAYGNVLLAQESEAILINNRDVLQQNLDETRKIYENGLGEEESVEQLQITLAGLGSLLNNATRLKKISLQLFNITLGIDLNTNVSLTDSLETLSEDFVSLELLNARTSIENTIDYKIAENDVKSKELLVKLEKSKALPRLAAYLNGGYLGFSDDFTFFNSDQRWAGFSSFGLNLNVPIFSSGGRAAKTERAKINLEKSQLNLSDVEQQTLLQIETARSNYRFAIEDFEIKKDNLQLAERIEAKNQTKFFEGIGSSFELRQAQLQLYTAQNEYLEAMLAVINQKTELETALNLPNN